MGIKKTLFETIYFHHNFSYMKIKAVTVISEDNCFPLFKNIGFSHFGIKIYKNANIKFKAFNNLNVCITCNEIYGPEIYSEHLLNNFFRLSNYYQHIL